MIVLIHEEASNKMYIGTTDTKTATGLVNKNIDGLIELKKQVEGGRFRELKPGDAIPCKLDCYYVVNLEEISIEID